MDDPHYKQLTSGGYYTTFCEAAGFSENDPSFTRIGEHRYHAAVRRMPDGTLKYWVHWGDMDTADFRLDNPNIMWFDDAKEALAWLVACARME